MDPVFQLQQAAKRQKEKAHKRKLDVAAHCRHKYDGGPVPRGRGAAPSEEEEEAWLVSQGKRMRPELELRAKRQQEREEQEELLQGVLSELLTESSEDCEDDTKT